MAERDDKQTQAGAIELPPPKNAGVSRRVLPTRRIAFQKQLDILRAYAAASGGTRTTVTNEAVGKVVGLSASTVSLANAFFVDVGLIERTEGRHAPAREILEYARAHQWDADYAGRELASPLRGTWFGSTLLPLLSFSSKTEDEAIRELAKAGNAEPQYKGQVRMLLEYLQAAGLIILENGQVRADLDSDPPTGPIDRGDTQAPLEETPKPEPVPAGLSGPMPLLLQGLLAELPRGGNWNWADASRWLAYAEATFEMVYEFEDEKPARRRSPNGERSHPSPDEEGGPSP